MNPLSITLAATEAPHALALVGAEPAFTSSFAALAAAAAPLVQRLHDTRLPARRPVALVAHPDAPSIITLLALLEHGAPALLLHPRWTTTERAAVLAQAQPALVIEHDHWQVPAADASASADTAPLTAPDTAAIVYTSGSTALPRGVELSTRALVAAAAASAANLGWQADDRWLLCLPFAHVGGLSVITRCLLARRSLALGAPDPATLVATLAATRATLLSLVPTTLARVVDHGAAPPPCLRAVLVGGAAAAPTLLTRARAAGWPILTSYGLSETAAQVATQPYPTSAGSGTSTGCGPALPGVALRIGPDQHIQVAGPTLFTGYFPGSPRAAGWLDTGDLGHLDAAGNLHVHGRADDVIITGGEKVSPSEVEAALTAIPGVAAACVFALPDATWGSLVAAAIITSATAPPSDVALASALAAALAPYKRPRLIADLSLPGLPTLTSGKLDRTACAHAATAAASLRPLAYPPASVANAVTMAAGGAAR